MPRTYETVDSDTEFKVASIMEKYHQPIYEAKVELNILFAHGPKDAEGETTGPAIAVNGYPALASIKINNLKDRAAGLRDATLLIDGDQWPLTPDPRKLAIIDHELEHLEIKADEDGTIQTDDLGRPKLKIRLHDFHFGGFMSIAERHKDDSVESETVKHVGKMMVRQGVFPGF